METTATGTGATRSEAREEACRLIAKKLGIGKKKAVKKHKASEDNSIPAKENTAEKIQKEYPKKGIKARYQKQNKKEFKKRIKKPVAKAK